MTDPGRPAFGCVAGFARGGAAGSRGGRRDSEYAVLVDRGC